MKWIIMIIITAMLIAGWIADGMIKKDLEKKVERMFYATWNGNDSDRLYAWQRVISSISSTDTSIYTPDKIEIARQRLETERRFQNGQYRSVNFNTKLNYN